MKKIILIALLLFSCTVEEITVNSVEEQIIFEPQSFDEDPLYSQIDPMDPYSFLEVFIMDAERHGIDLSNIDTKTAVFTMVPGQERLGVSRNYCNSNQVTITLQKEFWEQATTLKSSNYRKIQLMWHELGHELLKLNHTCSRGHIMTSNTPSCPHTTEGWYYDLWNFKYKAEDENINWQRAVEDMFNGVDQQYFNCISSKTQGYIH